MAGARQPAASTAEADDPVPPRETDAQTRPWPPTLGPRPDNRGPRAPGARPRRGTLLVGRALQSVDRAAAGPAGGQRDPISGELPVTSGTRPWRGPPGHGGQGAGRGRRCWRCSPGRRTRWRIGTGALDGPDRVARGPPRRSSAAPPGELGKVPAAPLPAGAVMDRWTTPYGRPVHPFRISVGVTQRQGLLFGGRVSRRRKLRLRPGSGYR